MQERCDMKKKSSNSVLIVSLTLAVLIGITVIVIFTTNKSADTITNSKCDHHFEVISSTSPTEFSPGMTLYKCSQCGEEKNERVKADSVMPQIYLDGTLDSIAKDSTVLVKSEYFDDEQSFISNATIKYQGHTSMNYGKKNYTIKFYKDEGDKKKNEVSIHGWEKSNKYCLKANFIDYSQSRNIVCNNIWSEVVRTRTNLNSNIANLQKYGAIDGFPIMMFINNEYQGMYTINIPKDDDTYNIGDNEGEALFVINSPMSESAKFRTVLTNDDKQSIFDLEYCYGDETWAYTSLDNLINFVIQNDGESFRDGIEQYLDIDSAIDYLITAYYLGLTDNYAKNVLLLTFDGKQWIVSLYDMDAAFGLAFDGSEIFDANYLLPKKNADGTISSETGSLLWDRIINNYPDKIKSRYFELRKNILDNERVIGRLQSFTGSIPQQVYDKELEIWGEIPMHDKNNIEQIREYVYHRSQLLDSFFNSLEGVR